MSDVDGNVTRDLWAADLQVISVDTGANSVSGIYDPGRSFRVRVASQELVDIQFDCNTRLATFPELIPGISLPRMMRITVERYGTSSCHVSEP